MFVFLTGAVGKKRKFCYIDFTLAYNSLVSAELLFNEILLLGLWCVWGREGRSCGVFVVVVGVCLCALGGGG